jgi:Ca-activated chloride channel family protein
MKTENNEHLITLYLLGDLDEAQAAEVKQLLENSEESRALAKELEPTLDLLRDALADSTLSAVPPVELTPDMKAAVLLSEEAENAPAAAEPAPVKKKGILLQLGETPRALGNVAALFLATVISAGIWIVYGPGPAGVMQTSRMDDFVGAEKIAAAIAPIIVAPEDDMTGQIVEGMDKGREERGGDTLDGRWYATDPSEPILEDNQEDAKAPSRLRTTAKQTSHAENTFQSVFDPNRNPFDEAAGSARGELVSPSAPRTATTAAGRVTLDEQAVPLVTTPGEATGKMQDAREKSKLSLESSLARNEQLDRLNRLAAPLETNKRRAAMEDENRASGPGKARDGREVTRSETKSLERGSGRVDEKLGEASARRPMEQAAEARAKYTGDGNTIPVKPHSVSERKQAILIAGEVAQGSFAGGGGGGLKLANEEILSPDHRTGLAFGGKDLAGTPAPAGAFANRGLVEHSEQELLAQTSDLQAGEARPGPARQKGQAHARKASKTPVKEITVVDRISASRTSHLGSTREVTKSLSGKSANTPSPHPSAFGKKSAFGDDLPVPELVDAPARNGTRWHYYERGEGESPGTEGKEARIEGIAGRSIPGQDYDKKAKNRSTKREGQNKATFTVPLGSSPDSVDQGKRGTVGTEFFRLEGETLGDRETLRHEGFKNLAKPDPFSTKQPAPAKIAEPAAAPKPVPGDKAEELFKGIDEASPSRKPSSRLASTDADEDGVLDLIEGGVLDALFGLDPSGEKDILGNLAFSIRPSVEGSKQEQWESPAEEEEPSVYQAYSFNPYVDTVANPLSTFAIDVDSASFTQARNYMRQGMLPPPDAVRTEEFINFFNYHYPSPARGLFAIHNQAAPSPFGSGYLLKVGVKGKVVGRDQQRPAKLTFVIDTSGSMDTPDRLGLARRSLKMLIGHLADHDEVAIVQYDFKARIVLNHTPASERKRIAAAIDGLQVTGSTNLEDGIQLGYATAASGFDPDAVNRILLISDGMANLGNEDAASILKKVEGFREQGIYSSVFGFGLGNYNDTMLETLANKGNGVYHFIDSLDEAKRVFVDNLSATLNVIAADVKIQVEFNPQRVKRYRQLGYENRQLKSEQFRDDTVDAGEIGSGQAATALYEIDLAGNPADPLGTVHVRYRNVETGEVEEISRDILAADLVRQYENTDSRFQLAACTAEFAEILRGSPFAVDNDYARVADTLRPVAQRLHLDQNIQELMRLVRSASGLPRASK